MLVSRISNLLDELTEAHKRLKPGSKKLIFFRTNDGVPVTHSEDIKLIESFVLAIGFDLEYMAGTPLLTKPKTPEFLFKEIENLLKNYQPKNQLEYE